MPLEGMAIRAPISGSSLAPSSSLCPTTKMVLIRCPPLRTSFFSGGVGKLKAIGIQTSNCSKLKYVGRGGGALGSQMNLFDRLARVVKSYANAILSSVEDPEKILDQAVLEMNDDLTKMRQATAQVLASQKRMENKYKAAQQASDDWYRRAQLALEKGDENLAREALKRRKSYADNANSLKTQLEQQRSVVDNLVSNTRVPPEVVCWRNLWETDEARTGDGLVEVEKAQFGVGEGAGWSGHSPNDATKQLPAPFKVLFHSAMLLESKMQEARSKKDTLKARAQSAKTATKVSEMLGNVNTSSALSAFEKMEEKVMAMESQAEALNQLTSDDLEGKFALLENSSVDEDLVKLKRELSGASLKGELPAGRTTFSSASAAFPFRDVEIENELNELRRRAKD